MHFFFPDSQDFIDPSFNFLTEERKLGRVRQRDDLYAHECFLKKAYDGLLISRAFVEGYEGSSEKTRYSEGQKNRLYREKAHVFFRLDARYKVMGDCGAFAYAKEDKPPYSVESLIDFYVNTGVDLGISLDHIVFDYFNSKSTLDNCPDKHIEVMRDRVALTLENSRKFMSYRKEYNFIAYGVAHGWDKESYTNSVIELQKMGYKKITLGGLIPLKTEQLLDLLSFIKTHITKPVEFHLLGIGRTEVANEFRNYYVTSIDSTTPLKKSFMNPRKNYELGHENYCAIRVPQTSGNVQLKQKISSGVLAWENMVKKENYALQCLRDYDLGLCSLDDTLSAVLDYENCCSGRGDMMEYEYRRTLTCSPWKNCNCEICKKLLVLK